MPSVTQGRAFGRGAPARGVPAATGSNRPAPLPRHGGADPRGPARPRPPEGPDAEARGGARHSLTSRAAWTIGCYGASLALRLGGNVVMTWLLAPQILGVMVVVNSVRVGVELLTDVGIEQNIVHNPDGAKADFIDTAWTLQVLRGLGLSVLACALSGPLSAFFGIERAVFLAVGLAPLINALHSTYVFGLVRGLDVRARNLFELSAEAISFCVTVTLVVLYPTVWALVAGTLCALGIRSGLSYLIPGAAHRPMLVARYVREMLGFGKWIVVSSLVIYASGNLDRLFLAKSIPLATLGIYGLARTIAELPPTLAGRLSYQILFPALAAARNEADGGAAHDALTGGRRLLVLAAALGLGSAVAWADLAVRLVYDPRYGAAGGMLSVLLVGAWFSVLSNLNEATLLGLGKPSYGSLSNGVRLAVLAAGLPLGLAHLGLPGALGAMVLSETARYGAVLYGQRRVGLSYLGQDAGSSALFAATVLAWALARWAAGLGEAWGGVLHGA